LASLLPEKKRALMEKQTTSVRYKIICVLSDETPVQLELTKTLEEAISSVENLSPKFRTVSELRIYEVKTTESVKLVYRDIKLAM
jgi:hypothetical protein